MNTANILLRNSQSDVSHPACTGADVALGKPETVNGMEIEIFSDVSSLENEWLDLEKECLPSIYQHYYWVKVALETIDNQFRPFVVTGWLDGKLSFVFPLVLEQGGIKKLRWAGGSHANICCGMFSVEATERLDPKSLKKLLRLLGKRAGGISILQLDNQLRESKGNPNPMLLLPHSTAINPMFLMDLSEGFDAMLEAGNAKRKRKAFRRQVRIAEQNGGHELFIPKSDQEIRETVREFRELKAVRFRELGISDVFATDEAGEFLEKLALLPERNGIRPFEFAVLKIGNKTRAMYAGAIINEYYQAAINTISSDELTQISPGEMLLYLFVEHLAESGITGLDLGVGEERYKRSWCQKEDRLYNTILPLNIVSIPAATGIRSYKAIKRYLRNNPYIWQTLKKLRKAKARKS